MKRCTTRTTNVRNTALLGSLILSIGLLGSAYAEEQPLPLKQPYDDKICIFTIVDDRARFICNWDWLLPSEILSKINQTELPTNPSDLAMHNVGLADQISIWIEKAKQEQIEEQKRIAEIQEPEPEPLTREEREIESAVKVLAKCQTGLGAFGAYQEQADIEYYTDQSRWEFQIRDNLSQSPVIGNMLKAIEECRIMVRYAEMGLIGDYELNKIMADLAGVDYLGRTAEHPLARPVTDQSDSMVQTDPVTPKDIADEITEMEQLRDKLIEERVFEDPDAEFTGENRGFQPAGLRCSVFGQPAPVGVWAEEKCPLSLYETHILKNWDDITYTDILQLQCDNFLYIYQHKLGTDEFPKWLNHCVPKVVRNN